MEKSITSPLPVAVEVEEEVAEDEEDFVLPADAGAVRAGEGRGAGYARYGASAEGESAHIPS